ncbi:hypothetical protein PILCRDRAFT_14520 [Piloderma croceum F 1598]|uniref:Cation/H+ exchanger domain-containing protein n=1 Tax=Piloderma croceum (strain F 1598) TaxID=765440 RepID=A0A0C3F2S2_PILCF|nr:hypothetical protein PILCRDRAFT_14520 [Piloderma croceum F 1598]
MPGHPFPDSPVLTNSAWSYLRRTDFLMNGPSVLPQNKTNPFHPTMSRMRSMCLLGIAMVTRGEIALIVAQLARPLLVSTSDTNGGASSTDSELFAIVIWAILISTVGGAVGVGLVLRTNRTAIGVAQ